MPHHCKALIINCMDFRFHTAIREFLISLGLKDTYDLVSLAGVTKGLVEDDPSSTELILKQVDGSLKLHNISELYLIHHMDCGGYGGHSAFNSIEEEKERQLTDLEAARTIISRKFPDLEIKKILARIEEADGKYNIDFERIQ